jgi:hypothetical protein
MPPLPLKRVLLPPQKKRKREKIHLPHLQKLPQVNI